MFLVNVEKIKNFKIKKYEMVKHSSRIFRSHNTGKYYKLDCYQINGKEFTVMDGVIVGHQANITKHELKRIKDIFEI